MTKRELQEQNENLREKLEEAYDVIGDALGFEDESVESGEREDTESEIGDESETESEDE